MREKELKYWLGLSALEPIGPVRFKRIINHFNQISDFFKADRKSLTAAGIEPWIVNKVIESRASLNIEEKWKQLKNEEIKLITFRDDDYPKLLKEIYDFPPLLYVRGNLRKEDKFSLAVVGTRRPSTYGQQITEEIVEGLTQSKVAIVSGLAYGIDSQAHQAAIDFGGRTIAVLGTGLDWQSVYPRQNRKLVEEIIASGGAVVSEFPCGMPAHKQNFPRRNRLISGLSLGVVVIEGNEDSGSLITARCALEQNREVFAVPGSIYNENSAGPNNLIKQGARVVTRANDILEALDLTLVKEFVKLEKVTADSKEEEILLQFISKEPKHIDQLILASGLKSEVVNSVLVIMEVKGKVKNLGGQRYVRG